MTRGHLTYTKISTTLTDVTSSARPAARFSQSMISSLTNQGKLRFMVYDGALNTAIFLRFLRRLVKDAARKVFLIVDNLRVHRAKVVTAWVQENADRVELFYLPRAQSR